MAAATALADAGQNVILADHAPKIGGAVYAQNRTGVDSTRFHRKESQALFTSLAGQASRIDIRCSTSFAGIDYQGNALLTGAGGLLFRPRAIVMATGARELVRPRPGWTLPRVTTVGAVQIGLKTTGQVPAGRIVIAGSGPLLYALGAQLASAGNPPIAVIDAARPFSHPLTALRLPFPILREAAGYFLALVRARVPILAGTSLLAIKEEGAALQVATSHTGRFAAFSCDRLCLHDGLASNDYGLPSNPVIPVIAAGDCRKVLGRFAAVKDGNRAAAEVLARLNLAGNKVRQQSLLSDETAQARLGKMFAHDASAELASLPDDTVLCRCENRTLADLRSLAPEERSARMLRLNGRFGMGACQGRFCLDWVARLAGNTPEPNQIRGQRWPVMPIPVADLLNAADRSREDIHNQPESTK
jgi:hypothetical protein